MGEQRTNSIRARALVAFLDEHHARSLWAVQAASTLLTAYMSNGRVFIVQEFGRRGGGEGWEVFIPAHDGNSGPATLAAVREYLNGSQSNAVHAAADALSMDMRRMLDDKEREVAALRAERDKWREVAQHGRAAVQEFMDLEIVAAVGPDGVHLNDSDLWYDDLVDASQAGKPRSRCSCTG